MLLNTWITDLNALLGRHLADCSLYVMRVLMPEAYISHGNSPHSADRNIGAVMYEGSTANNMDRQQGKF